jgi:hypothetical protein
MYRRKIVMAMLATIAFFHSRTNCQKVGGHHLYAEKEKKETLTMSYSHMTCI